MPGANHVVLASGAVVAVSVAMAAAIALYESPELRRYADDVRRRIAMAFYNLGDGINPPERDPLFNRPEDAHGFLQSSAEPGVDADEETRRRQREELLYWNSVRLARDAEKAGLEQGEEASEAPVPISPSHRGSSFDQFLRPDASGEKGSYVFNTGTETVADSNGLRRRGGDTTRSFPSLYANPFADENGISHDEVADRQIAPDRDEIMSDTTDIYSATTVDRPVMHPLAVPAAVPESLPSLIDVESAPTPTESSATVDREPESQEYATAGQEDREEAYASIQAWAQNSAAPGFYSPLPSTPAVPQSEPELLSDGQLTPTDSASLVGSGEDIANDALSSRDGESGRAFDVISESDGMMTPASWSEVGSVISESDTPAPVHA